LKTGKIVPSKLLKNKYSVFSGYAKYDHIYTNIYFCDLKNLTDVPDFTILIKSTAINTNANMEFHGGWKLQGSECIKMKKNTDVVKNISKIHRFVKNKRNGVPRGILNHEFLFGKPISVKKYVFGIVCYNAESFIKINKMIIRYGYNIQIYNEHIPTSFV